MYIWVIGKAIPRKENNMYGSFEFEQASMLARNGMKVIYIGLDFRPINHWRKWGVFQNEYENLTAYELSLPIRPLPFFQKNIEYLFIKRLYNRIEKKYGLPNLIHVHFPSIINASIHSDYQRKGVKIIATEHWTKVLTKNLSKIYFYNLEWFVKYADAMICVGEPLRKSIYELIDTKNEIAIVPNIINKEFRYKPSIKNKKYTFIGVGRLVPVKRFDLMIDAFSIAFSQNDPVELNIVGAGQEYINLKKQIEKLNRTKQIHLLGVKNREETAEEIQKSDALICASNLETFGVPVIEAWACGKPVISSDAIGFLECFDEYLGIIVKADDKEQLVNAMIELFDKRYTFDEKKISDFANLHFSEKAVFCRLNSIYDSIVKFKD